MKDRWQYSTRFLLEGFSLVAISLGLGRLAWTSYNPNPGTFEELIFPPAIYGMLACSGAAIGGIFGRRLFGALCSIGAFFVAYSLVAIGMVVYTFVFA